MEVSALAGQGKVCWLENPRLYHFSETSFYQISFIVIIIFTYSNIPGPSLAALFESFCLQPFCGVIGKLSAIFIMPYLRLGISPKGGTLKPLAQSFYIFLHFYRMCGGIPH